MRRSASRSRHHHHYGSTGRRLRRSQRRNKRQAAIKGLVMSAIVFGASGKPKASTRGDTALPKAEVRVSIDSFAALPPSLAYDDIIEEAARTFELDGDLIHAVIQAESSFNPLAESAAGAQGLMQLMPEVQQDFAVLDPFDPRENIMAGSQHLKRLLERHKGDIALALASYNAGPGNVTKFKGIPPFKETRNYVKKIKAMLADEAVD
jgi:soluble lytic murein transglycosylase-like protein